MCSFHLMWFHVDCVHSVVKVSWLYMCPFARAASHCRHGSRIRHSISGQPLAPVPFVPAVRCNCARGTTCKTWNGQPNWDPVKTCWFPFMCPHVISSTPRSTLPPALLDSGPARYTSSSSVVVDGIRARTFKSKLEDVEEDQFDGVASHSH